MESRSPSSMPPTLVNLSVDVHRFGAAHLRSGRKAAAGCFPRDSCSGCRLPMLISTVLIFFSGSTIASGSGMGPYSSCRVILICRSALGCKPPTEAQHFHQRAIALQRINAGPDKQAHEEHRLAAELHHGDEDLRLADVFAQAFDQVRLHFLEGHSSGVDVADQRQIDVSVAIDPKRPVIDFLRLGRSNQNLIVRSQYIVRPNRIGRKLLDRLSRRFAARDWSAWQGLRRSPGCGSDRLD